MRGHWTLPAEPDAVEMARDIVRSVLTAKPGKPSGCRAAESVAGELLMNAVHRAQGSPDLTVIDLTVTTSVGRVHIEVTDAAGAPPLLALPGGGDGSEAPLDEPVRRAWGWRSLDDGRAMWCEIAWDEQAEHAARHQPAL